MNSPVRTRGHSSIEIGGVSTEVKQAELEFSAPVTSLPPDGPLPQGVEGVPGVVSPQEASLGQKKYAKTLRLTSDQLVCISQPQISQHFLYLCRDRSISNQGGTM